MTSLLSALKSIGSLIFGDIKSILILILLAGLLFFYYQSNCADAKIARLELSNINSEIIIERMKNDFDNNTAALIERESEIKNIKQQNEELLKELEEVMISEPEAKTWGDTSIPDSIMRRLRD